MNFNEAKKLLREQGYNVTKTQPSDYGIWEALYKVWRVVDQDGAPAIRSWELSAEQIKTLVSRAVYQHRTATGAVEAVTISEVAA